MSAAPQPPFGPDQIESLITLNRALLNQHLLRGVAHDLRNNLQVVALGSSLATVAASEVDALPAPR